jgi:hypothetical protein
MQTMMSVEVDRPIKEVFDYTIKNVAEWSTIVVKDEVIEEKPEGVGSTFRVTTEEKGRRMEFEGLVTRHEPPTAHAVLMKGSLFDIEAEYLFEDFGGRTRVTQRSKVQGKGFIKVISFLLGWLMKKSSRSALEKDLLNLKRLAEARKGLPA